MVYVKWSDGTAVEINAGIYSHARLLVPMKQKITFQGPNWYVDVEDMRYSHEINSIEVKLNKKQLDTIMKAMRAVEHGN